MACRDTCYEDNETGPGTESGWDSGGFTVQNNHEQSLPDDNVEKELAIWKLMGDPRQVSQRQKKNARSRFKESLFSSVVSDGRLQGGRVWDMGFGGEAGPKKGTSREWQPCSPPLWGLRFFFTGPLSHFFYLFMEHWIPSEVPWAGVKRLLLDRLLFAPAFLLLFFLIMNFLEFQVDIAVIQPLSAMLTASVTTQLHLQHHGLSSLRCANIQHFLIGRDTAAVAVQIRRSFWPALRMNWQVWTPAQFVNINYVPLQFRVLFANLVSLFWYIYLASLGK
uniref:Peroxisomal membrane protein 2 n=1 Tax=Ursus maritimus TaxID=29073 RepID=A0A452T4N6_URSMA